MTMKTPNIILLAEIISDVYSIQFQLWRPTQTCKWWRW